MVKHYWAGSSNHLHIFFLKIHLWKSCFKVASSWLLQLFVKFLFMNNADELWHAQDIKIVHLWVCGFIRHVMKKLQSCWLIESRNNIIMGSIYRTLSFYSKCYEKANRGVNVNEKMPCWSSWRTQAAHISHRRSNRPCDNTGHRYPT